MSGAYTYSGDGVCRSCDASILWFTTPAGKRMPVDDCRAAVFRTLSPGDVVEGEEVQGLLDNCHFASCPNANSHRRGR